MRLKRIISGGQTGVDRGGLEAAMALGIAHGGWCPRGRRAEDGVIPSRYQLVELESPHYPDRTERNVLDSDGTLVISNSEPSGGTALTCRLALRHGKPLLIVRLDQACAPEEVRAWLQTHEIDALNVAGPRESDFPGGEEQSRDFLVSVLTI